MFVAPADVDSVPDLGVRSRHRKDTYGLAAGGSAVARTDDKFDELGHPACARFGRYNWSCIGRTRSRTWRVPTNDDIGGWVLGDNDSLFRFGLLIRPLKARTNAPSSANIRTAVVAANKVRDRDSARPRCTFRAQPILDCRSRPRTTNQYRHFRVLVRDRFVPRQGRYRGFALND